MGNVFVRPAFPDPRHNRRASVFFTTVWSNFAVVSLVAILKALIQPSQILSTNLPGVVFIALASLFVLELSRRGQTTFACWFYILGNIAYVTYRALYLGGIHSPAMTMYCAFA